jgi:hypothetical protein
MSSSARSQTAAETSPRRMLRLVGSWIGWTGVSVMLTFSCYCAAGAYALDQVGNPDSEVGAASVFTPSQWQIDELAVLER